jgi:hypothetical protein
MKNHEVIMVNDIDDQTKGGYCHHCGEWTESWFFDDSNRWTKFGTIRIGSNATNLNRYCSAERKPKPDFSAIKSWRELSRWPEAIALREELKNKYKQVYEERFGISGKRKR